jgi:hypothetical protein
MHHSKTSQLSHLLAHQLIRGPWTLLTEAEALYSGLDNPWSSLSHALSAISRWQPVRWGLADRYHPRSCIANSIDLPGSSAISSLSHPPKAWALSLWICASWWPGMVFFFCKEYGEEFNPKHWLARSDVGGCDGGGWPASHARAGFGELIFSLSLYCSFFFFPSRVHLSLQCPGVATVAAYRPHHKDVPLAAEFIRLVTRHTEEVDGQLLLAQLNRVRVGDALGELMHGTSPLPL